MKNTMFLTPDQEQARKEKEQAIESLKYNSMCYGCKEFCADCGGTTEKLWSGCIWYKKTDFPSVYALAAYVPELIKNEDISSFDEFLKELKEDRSGLVEYIKDRVRDFCFKNEVLTEKYVDACKKILNLLGEENPTDKIDFSKHEKEMEKFRNSFLKPFEKELDKGRKELKKLGLEV